MNTRRTLILNPDRPHGRYGSLKRLVAAAAAAGALAVASAHAQYTSNNDELLLGFTTSSSVDDLVIDLGNPSAVGVGGTVTRDLTASTNVGLSASALQARLNDLYGDMDLLSWGVVGGHYRSAVNSAIYTTVAHGAAAPSLASTAFGFATGCIDTSGSVITSGNSGVEDPSAQNGDSWSEIIAPGSTLYCFVNQCVNPDSTTGVSFASATNYQVADFYCLSKATTSVTLLGTFTLGSDGSLTFTPASTTAKPPAPELTVSHSGTSAIISFATTNGATYTLYYTNAAGLGRPVADWAVSATTLTGNGQTMSFTNAATDSTRFYRVGAK